VIKSASGTCLLTETTQSGFVIRERSRKDFQRDLATKSRIARTIHFPHSAGAYGTDDFVRTASAPRSKVHDFEKGVIEVS
jgi:hypothetical protein